MRLNFLTLLLLNLVIRPTSNNHVKRDKLPDCQDNYEVDATIAHGFSKNAVVGGRPREQVFEPKE